MHELDGLVHSILGFLWVYHLLPNPMCSSAGDDALGPAYSSNTGQSYFCPSLEHSKNWSQPYGGL